MAKDGELEIDDGRVKEEEDDGDGGYGRVDGGFSMDSREVVGVRDRVFGLGFG